MAQIDKLVVSVEFNGAGIEDLKEAVVQHYHDECLRAGLVCTRPLRDAVAAAVGTALADIQTVQAVGRAIADWQPPCSPSPMYPPRQADKAMVSDDVLEAQWKAYQECRMPNVRVEKSERQAAPPDGNPYSDLPLSANPCRDIPPPKLLPRELTAAEREMILASVREQYGARAEQAERERLEVQVKAGEEYDAAAAEIDRAVVVVLREIGYPAAAGQLAALAARLVDEVIEAADTSLDGRTVIGRSQTLHNLNWLLRNKFPPEKIDAGRIARLGVKKAGSADMPPPPGK
jgi:hypothetical protein